MTEPAATSNFSNLWTRAITGVVLVIIATGALWFGEWSFFLLVTFLAGAMMYEWCGLIKEPNRKRLTATVLMIGLMMLFSPTYAPVDQSDVLATAIIGVTVGLGLWSVRLGLGYLYIALASVAIIFLREQGGLILTLWTLAVVWGTDIGAYFAGKTIGGPKLAPQVSPNKTWAGLIGGIAAAAIVSLVFVQITELNPVIIALAPALAVLAQLGDLLESWLKRKADVKDSSNLFPGHGGALDRLDGILPVAICVAGLTATGWLVS